MRFMNHACASNKYILATRWRNIHHFQILATCFLTKCPADGKIDNIMIALILTLKLYVRLGFHGWLTKLQCQFTSPLSIFIRIKYVHCEFWILQFSARVSLHFTLAYWHLSANIEDARTRDHSKSK